MSTILSITTDRKKGGIATALASYSAALAGHHHRHIVLLPSNAVAAAMLSGMSGVRLITMPAPAIRFHLMTGAIFHAELRAAIRNADVFFVHNASLTPMARRFRKPVCLISHSGKLRHLKAADHAVFLSRAAASRAAEATVNLCAGAPQLHIIPHGFPPYESRPGPTKPDDTVRVMAAGRFVQKKGFEVLLEAAELLQRHRAGIQFDIYGDGPLGPELDAMAGRLGLGNVVFHGWQEPLDRAFAAADLFCLPSIEEPFGLVIGEAMGRGLPMVATRTDGPLDVIGHEGTIQEQTLSAGGLLVEPDDAAGLAQALAELAGNSDRLARTGEAARRRIVADFSMDALAGRLDRLIATAIQRRPATPW